MESNTKNVIQAVIEEALTRWPDHSLFANRINPDLGAGSALASHVQEKTARDTILWLKARFEEILGPIHLSLPEAEQEDSPSRPSASEYIQSFDVQQT